MELKKRKILFKLIKLFIPLITLLYRTYWFIFRPNTSGSKAILIFNSKVLMVKHTYGKKYTLPGGGIKKSENPKDCIRREIREELGVELKDVRFLGSFVSTAEYKKDHVSAFVANLSSDKVYPDNFEIEKIAWFNLESLPEIGEVSQKIFDLYKKRT